MTDAEGDVEAAQPLRPLNLSLPPIGPLATDMIVAAEASGASTAPIYPQRFYSFGNARTLGTHMSEARGKPRYMRQNTVAGEAVGAAHFPHFLQRAISRTHTMHSTASSLPVEEWKILFEKLDLESDGRLTGTVSLQRLREILEDDPVWMDTIPHEVQEYILTKADKNNDGKLDLDEFLEMVRGRWFPRRKRRAVRELLKQTVELVIPYKYSYQNQYSCSPPPLFMLTISLLQIIIFAYNSIVMYKVIGYVGLNGPLPFCSRLIYNPNKRHEVWRYVTYMLIHSGLFHAVFNIAVQLVLGIPLEMVHGWWRVMLVYVSGVLAGSLWTSVMRPSVFLSGASGGVYALITAHLGTVIMNFREMTCPWCRILVVVVVAMSDIVVYVYNMYVVGHSSPVSYPAHISGAVTGLLVGITALKNLRWERYERYIWVASILTFVVLMLTAIVWSLAAPAHFTGLAPELVTCISEREL